MLVLTRKKHQKILLRIGHTEIAIMLCEIGCGQAKIGIDAPLEVAIVREELVIESEEYPSCHRKNRTLVQRS